MTQVPGYCCFDLQASHTISQSSPQRRFALVESTISTGTVSQAIFPEIAI